MVDVSFHQPKINEIIAITISPIVRYVMNLNLLFDLFTSFSSAVHGFTRVGTIDSMKF
mgnify:CR=1 FL=1